MPRTRQQIQSVQDKKYITIPKRNNNSLFQKTSKCIEGVPLEVFMIIQKYLSEKDYRNLMNTNLSTFQSIKFETVRYTIISCSKWDEVHSCGEKNKREYVKELIYSVKDKSTQISMKFTGVNQQEILAYQDLFSRIREVYVEGMWKNSKLPFTEQMDFTIFNGISAVKLVRFDGVKRITKGLENIDHLELISSLTLCEVKKFDNLKSFKVAFCAVLKEVTIENIENVSINENAINSIKSIGSPKHLEIRSCSLEFSSFIENNPEIFKNCQSFLIRAILPALELNVFDCIKMIPKVELLHISYPEALCMAPIFLGKQLKLQGFDLSPWLHQRLPHIESLELMECAGLIISLPEMPELKELILTNVRDLQVLPTLPKLEKITIRQCKDLEKISHPLPALKVCSIDSCIKLHDISGLSSIHPTQISISKCPHVIPRR